MNYFLLIDGAFFEERLRPALTASWRSRSFAPCRDLCNMMLPRVETFHARYPVAEGESLVAQAAGQLVFEREFWYALVGELLLYSAEEMPEFQTCLDTLSLLVAPDQRSAIQQAHHGSRPLTFGAAAYRPDRSGLNDRADVRRLTKILASLDPSSWEAGLLLDLAEEEREEELAFAHQSFLVLSDTFRRGDEAGQVIVHESL